MKINDRKELHSKTAEELEKILKESYNTLSQIRLDNVQNKLKNTRSMTLTRKEIAIIKTILNEKAASNEVAGESQQSATSDVVDSAKEVKKKEGKAAPKK
jgi:ribosomal protein L29